jgi:hypothetical protein
MSVTPNFGFELLAPSQEQPEVPINYNTNKLDALLESLGGGGASDATEPVYFQLACSDLVTALTVAAGVGYLRAAHAFTLTEVRASLQTASSSGLPTMDIKKNGVTVLSTALSIDATEKTSKTAATPAVISVSAIADDDELSVDVTAAGTGAKGLIVTLIGHL